MAGPDPLELFLPPVQHWFRTTLGTPTKAQRLGWPLIAAGRNTLILAPTGSGKTLAAFLGCLDHLWRQRDSAPGVRVLYISPLKALNNDVYRNLQVPLAGVTAAAEQRGVTLPALDVAVRTGDTPTAERQRLVRRPPHVLITTPESLHLLLTSAARATLRTVTYCIIDEIHALCSNKRGVFLSLLLERLEALQEPRTARPVRIGLSATQRPLDEVARFLGGLENRAEGFTPRPVTIVDAGMRKDLDLGVISPAGSFVAIPERSVWPSIYRFLGEQIGAHRSTIVFANNRRVVERVTANLNEDREVARAHHGSVSLEVRAQTEQALKEGRLPAVVATASLELGIDMGAVDLVCQVESPGSIARGLQRVGRAGHLVGHTSKGRLISKTPADLLEQAALARAMAAGRVEETRVPVNCLDVLAQQVVAAVALESWSVPDLYALVRRAYPYRDLTPQAFETVLEMVSGRYQFGMPDSPDPFANRTPHSLAALQPRVSWDRVHNRLHALPGSQRLALVHGGTIPDTGQYAAYNRRGLRIGELDEEFIYERRVGDVFLLGTSAWRLDQIEADRVIVSPAEGLPALVPFWRGEKAGRSYELSLATGQLTRELAERLDQPDCLDWLKRECFLEHRAACDLLGYVRRQVLNAGDVPTDRTLVVEASRDQLGDWQVIVLSPFGSGVHLALRFALAAALRRRLGYSPQCLHHDNGLLLRLADSEEPVLDLFDGLTPENVEALILGELSDSALFALRFRQNAARALLMPNARPGQRAPLWLQRLRGRDLLQVCRRHPDFPIVQETFRECLHDHLDLARLQGVLRDIHAGDIRVVTRRGDSPSPFASGLLFEFTAANMYLQDGPESRTDGAAGLDLELLGELLGPTGTPTELDSRATRQVERRLRGTGQPPRSPAEMAEWLRRLGDLADDDLEGPMLGFLRELEGEGRVTRVELPRCPQPQRWILTEEDERYRRAFGLTPAPAEAQQDAAATIFQRFLHTHALVGLADVLRHYPFDAEWARRQLEDWAARGRVVRVPPPAGEGPLVPPDTPPQWAVPENYEQVQRTGLAMLRREVIACPPQRFADFVVRWQRSQPVSQTAGSAAVQDVLAILEGLPLPADLWEHSILPGRVDRYQPRWLDEAVAAGEWVWVSQGGSDNGAGLVAFWARDTLTQLPPPTHDTEPPAETERVLACLSRGGAQFVPDLARAAELAPSQARAALWQLVRRGLVTNDQFDVVRRGEDTAGPAEGRTAAHRRTALAPRRRVPTRPEGRWALVPWGRSEPEARALLLTELLLRRYGIVARELALLDPSLPPWRILYEVLSRLELAGQVRRGYFVEGLSGAQFALTEAARLLQDLDLPSTAAAPVVLVHSLDPANLYGSGAPLNVPLLAAGTQLFTRRPGNWLALKAGAPVLLIEQLGRRLTALPSASGDDLAAAVRLLPDILGSPGGSGRQHKLTVEEWNGQPVTTTPGRELLEAAGFVRDYQGMVLYTAWHS